MYPRLLVHAPCTPCAPSCLPVPLQPCLGGNARTAILATVNPSNQHVEETLNTLQFAQRTMNIVNTVVQNRLGPAPKGSSKEQVKRGEMVDLNSGSDQVHILHLSWNMEESLLE
eukprot:1149422-Pelagomonas_calceolata.AAC.10